MRTVLVVWALLLLPNLAISAEQEMRAHFIDVGQGACTLLEFPCGAVLIDTGGQDDAHTDHLTTFLREFFQRRTDLNDTLDLLVVSHPHLDHTRGIREVFGTCRVARYIDDGIVSGSGRAGPKFVRDSVANGTHGTAIREIRDEEITNLPSKAGLTDAVIDPISCPDCDPQIRVLSGGMDRNPGWTDGEFDNLNNHSVVLRVDYGESSFLFTGDLEEPALETLVDYYQGTNLLDVDVYLVGHHGSHNGTTPSLASAMTPDIAVIGVGKSTFGKHGKKGFNTYSFGHPRRSIIELLSGAIDGRRSEPIDVDVADAARRFSSFHVTKRIYATGWDGDVTIAAKSDGTMRVTATGFDDSEPVPLAGKLAGAERSPARIETTSPEPYRWNLPIPEKRPSSGGNGKTVLFDVSHGGTAGQSDWVIDGGFSDFADALVEAGYTVREYRGIDKNSDGAIRFFDDRRAELADQNEAVIEFGAIKDAAVFVMAEANRPLTKDERAALLQFVEAGNGLFLIADHYNADRNLNSWDATEVFNGHNRSTAQQFDIGGLYGDLRNPGDPSKGWLSENFGVRFRFNAIDCKDGVSDVVPPESAERITQDVQPLLMAAGSTLAIVDPARAKGLVYFAATDRATGWPSAIEGAGEGVYFGGRDEGPFVAISKPNAGKVALMGDSSPIEDRSAKYRNDQSGRAKRLHDGWNDDGSAAVLCLNLVEWLAKREAYVGFSTATGHAAGIATPTPMAPIEQDDPADGEPWGKPRGGYDPWNSDTFAAGSFGAPFPAGSAAPGGPEPAAVTVAAALQSAEGELVAVDGVIQSELNDQFGLKLADSLNADTFIAIQVPKAFRDQFSPRLNPAARGQRIRVIGTRGKYMGVPGVRDVNVIETVKVQPGGS